MPDSARNTLKRQSSGAELNPVAEAFLVVDYANHLRPHAIKISGLQSRRNSFFVLVFRRLKQCIDLRKFLEVKQEGFGALRAINNFNRSRLNFLRINDFSE